jgi:hypothetical protein
VIAQVMIVLFCLTTPVLPSVFKLGRQLRVLIGVDNNVRTMDKDDIER